MLIQRIQGTQKEEKIQSVNGDTDDYIISIILRSLFKNW